MLKSVSCCVMVAFFLAVGIVPNVSGFKQKKIQLEDDDEMSKHTNSRLLVFSVSSYRNLSTVECLLVQLSADIEFIYNDLVSNTQLSMSRYQLAVIQHEILQGIYVLSPLQLWIINKEG